MLKFFKYFIYFLIFLSLLLFYFLFTPLGQSSVYAIIGSNLSKKTDLDIEVKSLNIEHYPQIQIIMHIEKKAKLILWGYLDDTLIDMDYTLTSDCIATDLCVIDDNINIKGHIKGPFTRLALEGKGIALDGNVTYTAVKYPDKAEDVDIQMKDVNSSKLLRLLGQTAFIKGKANADVAFSLMSEKHKNGHIIYDVKDKNFKGIPLDLYTKVTMLDERHTFIIDVTSPYLTLNVSKGHYNQKEKRAKAFYVLDIKDLSKLEMLLGYKYKGIFYAKGEISYQKYLKVTGLSKSFGGMTEFNFERDGLKVHLDNISLEEIMDRFPFPSMLTANATGNIYYNFIQETMVVNSKLKNVKFKENEMVDIIHKKSAVDLCKETFDNSNLDLTYHNSTILGDLKLINENDHIYLTNTRIDTKDNSIDAYFDFQVKREEFSGKVFGSLDNPNVNLNMQKLIRYQMDKQVDKMIGRNNRKIMENMPMGNVAKDLATNMGNSFIKVFF